MIWGTLLLSWSPLESAPVSATRNGRAFLNEVLVNYTWSTFVTLLDGKYFLHIHWFTFNIHEVLFFCLFCFLDFLEFSRFFFKFVLFEYSESFWNCDFLVDFMIIWLLFWISKCFDVLIFWTFLMLWFLGYF